MIDINQLEDGIWWRYDPASCEVMICNPTEWHIETRVYVRDDLYNINRQPPHSNWSILGFKEGDTPRVELIEKRMSWDAEKVAPSPLTVADVVARLQQFDQSKTFEVFTCQSYDDGPENYQFFGNELKSQLSETEDSVVLDAWRL